MSAPYVMERLAKHDRKAFDCGAAPLTNYLHRQASQDQKRRVAVCFLLIEQQTKAIAGFYTLSAGSVDLGDLPEAWAKKLPRYPTVPIARVGRLAVDQQHLGQGLGGILLFDAIQRTTQTEMGVYAVVVDAKDDTAAAFYEYHGFTPLESNKRTLFLPLSDAVRKLAP